MTKLEILKGIKGKTSKQVAEDCGIQYTTFSAWENKRLVLPVKHIIALTEYFKMPFEILLEDVDVITKEEILATAISRLRS